MHQLLPVPLLLLALPGWAQQPPEVVAGHDIEAFRSLEAQRLVGDAAVDAWREFLVTYPTSALAEVAWERLRVSGALEEIWRAHPELRPVITDIERSWTVHHQTLSRQPTAVAVVPLEPDGTTVDRASSPWSGAVGTGLAVGGGVSGHLTGRLHRGPVALGGRLGRSSTWLGEVDLRGTVPVGLDTPLPTALFLDTAIDTRARVSLVGGAQARLPRSLLLEAGAGVMLDGDKVLPALRVEVLREVP